MKSHYELLDVAADASADEIKQAFRREIAKYHPDKVQHLGAEFQDIAAVRAAELTQAYKALSDPQLRTEYDAQLAVGATDAPPTVDVEPPPAYEAPAERPAPSAPAETVVAPPTPPPSADASRNHHGVIEFVKRAAVARLRSALEGEFGYFEETPVSGFEVACVPKATFWMRAQPPRVLGRVASTVDGPALAEAWNLAAKMKKDGQRDLCVFLMGAAVAPAGELASVIADQRRKPMPAGGRLIMVPVSTRDWSAHVPTDAPPVVKSLLARLRG